VEGRPDDRRQAFFPPFSRSSCTSAGVFAGGEGSPGSPRSNWVSSKKEDVLHRSSISATGEASAFTRFHDLPDLRRDRTLEKQKDAIFAGQKPGRAARHSRR